MSTNERLGRPVRDLPLHPDWHSEDEYINELLTFATSSELFRHLCGGVHVLDFLTTEPDLYTRVLPSEWRDWLDEIDIWDILQYVLHDKTPSTMPPQTLSEYLITVKRLCLQRGLDVAHGEPPPMPRHVAVGMKPKKINEVSNFASFVDDLSTKVSDRVGERVSLVDFGSGQNYLGRTLVCPPYNKDVIAIERKHHNVQGARGMDVHAKLSKKEKIMRNKKEYKKKLATFEGLSTPPPDDLAIQPAEVPDHVLEHLALERIEKPSLDKGSITYIEHDITDGSLQPILYPPSPHQTHHIVATDKPLNTPSIVPQDRKLLTISLHSCGNLSHHAIRSPRTHPQRLCHRHHRLLLQPPYRTPRPRHL